MNWYRRPTVWIGLLISLAGIVFLLSQIDIPGLLSRLRSVDLRAVFAAFLVMSLTPFIRGTRWQAILKAKVGFWKPFHADNIGYLINSILPLRAGEPARALIISRAQPDLSFAEAFSTVLVARIIDTMAAVALVGLVLLALDVPEGVRVGAYSLVILVIVAFVVMIIGAFARQRLVTLARAILTRLLPLSLADRLVRVGDDFLAGFAVMRSLRRLLWLMAATTALWLCYVLFDYLILLAFVPAPPLAWGALALCAASLSTVVPSSPAYVGVFHAAVAFVMSPYLGNDTAVAFAIVLHATELVITLLFGAYGLIMTGTTLSRISTAAETIAQAEPNAP